VDLWPNGTIRDSDAQCTRHHEGPLCALCEDGYQLNSASGKCVLCDAGGRTQGRAILCAVGGVFFIFGVATFCALRRFKDVAMILASALTAASDAAIVVVARCKVLLVFFQILGSITLSFPNVNLPPSFAAMARRAAALGISLGDFVADTCVGEFDYLHTLVAATAAPICVALSLFGSYGLYVTWTRADKEDRATFKRMVFLVFLLMTYTVYSTTSTVVIRSLQCDDDFKDSVHSRYYRDAYLYADYSVSCRSNRYALHRVYAILMVFCYPVGIPFVYFFMLLGAKDTIAPSNISLLAERIVKETENVGADIQRERREVTKFLEHEDEEEERHSGWIGAALLKFYKRKQEEDLLLAIKRGELRGQAFEYLATVRECGEAERENKVIAETPLARAADASMYDSIRRRGSVTSKATKDYKRAEAQATAGEAEQFFFQAPHGGGPAAAEETTGTVADFVDVGDRDLARRLSADAADAPEAKVPALKTHRSRASLAVAGADYQLEDYVNGKTARRTQATAVAAAATCRVLGHELVITSRDIEDSSAHLEFLFSEYDPPCWYFECLECVRRLLLTAVLPVPVIHAESLGQIVFACMAALFFASLYAYLRPFISDTMDAFANFMQGLLFLNLLFTLIPVWIASTGLGGPHQTSELSISVKSKSIRLIFGRIDCSRRVLEA